jgi:KDO2-lipid IV(A) lauroyltransferase
MGLMLPPWIGYALAQVAASLVCFFKPTMYHAVKGNLQIILGPDVDEKTLRRKTREVFLHAGRANYDFFHVVEEDAEEIARMMSVPQSVIDQIRQAIAEKRGVLLLGAHMSNFNLGILALGALGVPIQALSLSNPNEGFTILNHLRTKWGMELTPITAQSLRQAIRRLASGGVVMTAFDFPTPQHSQLFPFFGKPAYFPLGPARLVRNPDILVLMGSCRYDPETGYTLHTQTIEIERTNDRRHDTEVNARRMAAVLEDTVAQNPEQWLMFRPYWPESEAEVRVHDGDGREEHT